MEDADVSRLVRDVMSKINDVADNIRVSTSGQDIKRTPRTVCIAALPSTKPEATPLPSSAPQGACVQGEQANQPSKPDVDSPVRLPTRLSIGDHHGGVQGPEPLGAPVVRKEAIVVAPPATKDGAAAKKKSVRRR
jgi:hypothetical protein